MPQPSEPWITLQATDLNDYLVGAQATAMRTAALAPGQADTFTAVMTDVVNRVRSEIRSNIRNLVSQTPLSIPPDLKSPTMALLVEAISLRIPQLKLSDDQKKAADNARSYLVRVARGEVVITMPPDPMVPDDQERGAPITVIHADRRRYTHRQMRGL
jgi:hypothetical protein